MAETAPVAEVESAPPPRKRSPLLKVIVLAFIVMVIGAECLIALMYLPSSKQGEAVADTAAPAKPATESKHASAEAARPAAEDKHAAKESKHGGEGKHAGSDSKHAAGEGKSHQGAKQAEGGSGHAAGASDEIEVDLGEFTVTASHPAANTNLRIAFHLFGTAAALDEEEFTRRMKEIQHRFREQVLFTMRSAEVSDLTDAGLGLLKRTILEKTNSMLGKPLLKSVVFSDFSLIEM